jgi:polar amino acid transport system substrate-binding protein
MEMIIMRKTRLTLFILVLIIVLTTIGCSSKNTSTSTTEEAVKQKIKVAANVGNVPWEFQNGDKLVGFEVDLINAVAEKLNYDLEFINTPFTGLFPGLMGGKFDIVMSSVTIKPDRVDKMDFTQPYYDSDQSLVVETKTSYKGLADMKDKVIGVESGSTPDIWSQENKAKYGFKEVRLYNSFPEAMLDLAAGRLGGVIGDIPASLYYIKDKPNFAVAERITTNEKYGMVFKKGDPLRDKVNDEISNLKKDGTLGKIYKTWFGQDAVGSSVDVLPVPVK